MKLFKSPEHIENSNSPGLFLGGTIDMGSSIDWQAAVVEELKDVDIDIYNPRRAVWEVNLPQDPTPGTVFHEQVMWEIRAQMRANFRLYNFLPNSKSPITLMELGLFSRYINTYVCCPKEFYRYGNVKILCDEFYIPHFETIEEAIASIKTDIELFHVYE